MRDDRETEDFEVGYGKPPKSGQFKKGVSGNPTGRPKKALDYDRELIRELSSRVSINENGKRKSIRKYEGVMKQLSNKALGGSLSAIRLLIDLRREARERAGELRERSPYDPIPWATVRAEDLTDDEIAQFLVEAREAHQKAERREAAREKAARDEANGRKPGNRRMIGK